MNRTAVLYALLSAVLFGISTPAAKGLVGTVDPVLLAGLLYCGAGIGVTILRRLAHAVSAPAAIEQSLRRQDIPWLAGAMVAGGIAGPVLLMLGLARTDAAAASLLLTLEGAATALMAWFIFHENFDRRIALGMVCLVTGAIVLSWSGIPTFVVHSLSRPHMMQAPIMAIGPITVARHPAVPAESSVLLHYRG